MFCKWLTVIFVVCEIIHVLFDFWTKYHFEVFILFEFIICFIVNGGQNEFNIQIGDLKIHVKYSSIEFQSRWFKMNKVTRNWQWLHCELGKVCHNVLSFKADFKVLHALFSIATRSLNAISKKKFEENQNIYISTWKFLMIECLNGTKVSK